MIRGAAWMPRVSRLLRQPRLPRLLMLALVLLSGPAASAAEPGAEGPSTLDDFEILQYLAAGRYPPSALIALDNNSRILLACREGKSADALRLEGIEFADSQIELLIATNLLVRDSRGDLITTFPILDPGTVPRLREETASLADELLAVVRPDVEALARELEDAGLADHGYSLMFSYVLDGMVWGFLEEYQQVVPRRLSARRPFWSGEIWAMRPGREFTAGTRSIDHEGLKLKVSTSPASASHTLRLFADTSALREALEQYARSGRLEGGRPRQLLAEFGLVDADGLLAIPVIDEIEKGPVFRAAETVTSNLVDAILEKVDLVGLQERYGFRSAPQTLVIAYHELMWDLMERFETAGLVRRPGILSQPATAVRSDLADAAFLVDRRSKTPNRQDVLEPRRDSPEKPGPRSGGS